MVLEILNYFFFFKFNEALSTFYLWLYGIGHMVKDTQVAIDETRCSHSMGYSFQLAAMVLLYALSIDRIVHTIGELHQLWSSSWNNK